METHKEFAFMRHAELDLSKDFACGMINQLVNTVKELKEHVGNTPVAIFHSPLLRAQKTAEKLRDLLIDQDGIILTCKELSWLDCEEYEITPSNIQEVMVGEKADFVLFIGHKPDIQDYFKEFLNRKVHAFYCDIIYNKTC